MISPLYIKLIGAGAVALAVIGTMLHIRSLNNEIDGLNNTLIEVQGVVARQLVQIRELTDAREEVQKRLQEAELAAQTARARVITRIQRVPAPPAQCEPAIDWLRERALELQGDSR